MHDSSLTPVFISREPPRPPQWPPRPGPGQAGWGSSWLAQSSPDPAIPVCRRRRKWPLWHCPRGVHGVGRCMKSISLSPALLGPRGWSPDVVDLLPVRESLSRARSCNLLLAASTPEHGGGGHASDGRKGAGGQAETTEPDFSHHLARTDPFELADSPPPDGVRSKK